MNKDFWTSSTRPTAIIFCLQETKLQEGQVELDLRAMSNTGTTLSNRYWDCGLHFKIKLWR